MKFEHVCQLRQFFYILFVLFSFISVLNAQNNISAEQKSFFEKKIRPALVKYCYECHSLESGKTKGGLLLDTRERMLNGGDSGPVLDFKNPEESLFVIAITWAEKDYEMPPKHKMPESVIQDFIKWVKMGAPDPRKSEKIIVQSKVDIEKGRKHWAYQTPKSNKSEDIDHHIEAARKKAGLKSVGRADAHTFLRRLSFDLVGLPPHVDEIEDFVSRWKKNKTKAIEEKVDELLARKQYGERWGRHWLDVARYAETSGTLNFSFPYAWRYRDYVIDAFNKDKPYDEFIKEQVAGDLLKNKNKEEEQEHLIATGFLAVGVKRLNERNPRKFHMDLIDEQIDTTTRAFLGLTVACARCHDHKFDAIPTTDYYALAGIFMSTKTMYGTAAGMQNHRPSELLDLPIADKQMGGNDVAKVENIKKQLEEARNKMRETRRSQRRSGKEAERRVFVAMRNNIGRLEGMLKTMDESGKKRTVAMGVQEAHKVTNAKVLLRGEVEMPAQEVDRGFLQVLNFHGSKKIKKNSSGRLELAEWLSDKKNPLTARVMVNRIWMHLLGSPIVPTPNNWGVNGQGPNNQKLLDHLANRFMNLDWSVKKLIKEIVLSKTYQQSSKVHVSYYKKDPDNKYYWRANPYRLDAEAFRDSMLLVSDTLKLNRPYASEITKHGDFRFGRRINEQTFANENFHRSVYLPVLRDALPESLELFDFADPNASNAKREETNVPTQALYLMNSPLVINLSVEMAKQLDANFKKPEDKIKYAFLQVYGRPAKSDEIKLSLKLLDYFSKKKDSPNQTLAQRRQERQKAREMRRRGQGRGRGGPQVESKSMDAMAVFCHSLLNSAEFRIID